MAIRQEVHSMSPRPVWKWSGTLPTSQGTPSSELYDLRVWTDDLIESQTNTGFTTIHDARHGRHDRGGKFWTIKRKYYEYSTLGPDAKKFSSRPDPEDHTNRGTYYTIPTAYTSAVSNNSFPQINRSSNSELGALATVAINRCIPTLPEFDGSVAIAELLREGLPSLVMAQSIRDRALTAKNAGHEYLNVEFGWKPLLNDVKGLGLALKNDVTRLQNLLDNSNKLLRRRYHFPVEVTTDIRDDGRHYPRPGMTVYHSSTGKRTVTTVTRRRVWFSGAFQYHIQASDVIGPGLDKWLERARLLYGMRITPDVLWNLAPWSWLADWFFNISEVLTNIAMFKEDRLTMPWGYIMEHKTVDMTVQLSDIEFDSVPGAKQTLTQRFIIESKYRRKASPFSIGLDEGTLSNRQKAILGAVVASR